jgi:hypothetical protein
LARRGGTPAEVGVGRADVSLSDMEWVVVDEADVLLGAHSFPHVALRAITDVQK